MRRCLQLLGPLMGSLRWQLHVALSGRVRSHACHGWTVFFEDVTWWLHAWLSGESVPDLIGVYGGRDKGVRGLLAPAVLHAWCRSGPACYPVFLQVYHLFIMARPRGLCIGNLAFST